MDSHFHGNDEELFVKLTLGLSWEKINKGMNLLVEIASTLR